MAEGADSYEYTDFCWLNYLHGIYIPENDRFSRGRKLMVHPKIPIFQVDAFAHKPFTGNPAAICLLEKSMDKYWMQSIAAEMNLSETAFVLRRGDGFDLRWFTPTVEVDLCGHATLAAAHILWEQHWLPALDDTQFHTRSGILAARRDADRIILDFPVADVEAINAPAGLFQALDIKVGNVYFNQVDYLVQLENEKDVLSLQPDFSALEKIKARGIIVTAVSKHSECDFISRFFAPASGIDEDPVTGSAHCSLTPFWAQRLGKKTLQAFQASRRGGKLTVQLQGKRVKLAGQAITVFGGELHV
jgi:PhzF family phenazine biosynthesis protein